MNMLFNLLLCHELLLITKSESDNGLNFNLCSSSAHYRHDNVREFCRIYLFLKIGQRVSNQHDFKSSRLSSCWNLILHSNLPPFHFR
jgi:hypothetical protein